MDINCANADVSNLIEVQFIKENVSRRKILREINVMDKGNAPLKGLFLAVPISKGTEAKNGTLSMCGHRHRVVPSCYCTERLGSQPLVF